MCAQDWRKHYRSLKTEAEREEARAQRAKQAAEKAQIISKHQAQQRQKKKKQLSSNVTIKYADGGQHSLFGLNHESLVQGTSKSSYFVLYGLKQQQLALFAEPKMQPPACSCFWHLKYVLDKKQCHHSRLVLCLLLLACCP